MRIADAVFVLLLAVASSVDAGTPEGDAAQFAKTARDKLDLAERFIADGDFDNALRALREAEMFDAKVEPSRRASLRARAIKARDDPAVRAAAKARKDEEDAARAAQAAESERARAEAAAQ